MAITSPLVWVVNPALPVRTMPEFIAQVQAEPGNWRYGLPASGSIPHLVAEDTKIRHKLDMPAVPYRSTPQSLMAVISGEVPITLDSLGASAGHIAGGKLRALAVTSRERSERLPDVPTMLELGLDPREWVAWYAFMAPKGTPDEIIQKLNSRDQSGAARRGHRHAHPRAGRVAAPHDAGRDARLHQGGACRFRRHREGRQDSRGVARDALSCLGAARAGASRA